MSSSSTLTRMARPIVVLITSVILFQDLDLPLLASLKSFEAAPTSVPGDWQQLAPLPDKEGFAGSYAGVNNGALLVAGGSNFPDRKPWEGGRKVFYDTVYVLDKPKGTWKIAGKLPRPLGYGVSVSHGGGIVCVGGSDGDRHYADAFRLEWREGRLATSKLPPLPKLIANACGALVGDILYVAGGLEKPDAAKTLTTVYQIDLAAREPTWQEIEACPGSGRMLAVAAGLDGAFWLMGGADLVLGKDKKIERRYLKDAYRYFPEKGWKRIAELPYPIVAAPSPAPTDATGFTILGGDDGSQIDVDPAKHIGFSKKAIRYDAKTEKWVEAGELAAARVATPCVLWNKSWVVPGGEIRPGVRSPEVWRWVPRLRE